MSNLSFEPLIPPALWVGLALLAIASISWYALRRPASVPRRRWITIQVLTALAMLLVLIILLNPTWVVPIAPPAGKPQLTLLIDSSISMATPDAAPGKSRYQAALEAADTLKRAFADRMDIRLLSFTNRSTETTLEDMKKALPQGEVTNLATGIRESLDEGRAGSQAVVLFSDGIHNADADTEQVMEAVRLARALGAPVHTRTLGGINDARDLSIETRTPQELAFIQQKVPLTILLKQRGFKGSKSKITVMQAGKEIHRSDITFTQTQVQELRFMVHQDKPGLYQYEVKVDPLPGEVTEINNTCTCQLRVVDKPVRVLLLEGKPYWDTKFLQRTLLQDSSLDLDSVVQLSSNRYYFRRLGRDDQTKANEVAKMREERRTLNSFADFLKQGEGLKQYQIIILGRDADTYLDEATLTQLRTWLAQDGGSLICARGQPMARLSQRLAQMMPVRWSPTSELRFNLSFTEQGQNLHWLPSADGGLANDSLAQLPSLASTAKVEQPQPLSVVLAMSRSQVNGTETPAVTFQPYGSGRVVVVEGMGMWRWAFLPTHQQGLDDVYRSLWQSLLRWLISSVDLLPGQTIALRSDKISYRTRESVMATMILRDSAGASSAPAVELRDTQNRLLRTVMPTPHGEEPGTYRVAFGILPEGQYQAVVKSKDRAEPGATASFDVRGWSDEQLDLTARPDLMEQIAKQSGGVVLNGDQPMNLIDQLQKTMEKHDRQQVQRLMAWDRWWILLSLFILWGMTWWLRRASGLV